MLAERAWFSCCLLAARLLRSTRYSSTNVFTHQRELRIRKHRAFYAPALVGMAGVLYRVLDTGVRVLPQRAWIERERDMYATLYNCSVHVERDDTLILPRLDGTTLASLLVRPDLDNTTRIRAIELAVFALAALHRDGLTHGDAMADNVMIDLESSVARWFDFETVHEARRSTAWCKADDLRALLATCLLRTPQSLQSDTLRCILREYGDAEVIAQLATTFVSLRRRALAVHLAQAALSLGQYREIARLLQLPQEPGGPPKPTLPPPVASGAT